MTNDSASAARVAGDQVLASAAKRRPGRPGDDRRVELVLDLRK